MQCTMIATFLVLYLSSIATSISVLDSTNLRSSLLEHPLSLVMFEASWSPQSQEAKPVLEKIGSDKKDLFMASLDCETQETNDLCNEEKIMAYPTVRLYRKGKSFVDFNDDITTEKLTKFLSDPDGYPVVKDDFEAKEETPEPDIGLEVDALRVDLTKHEEFVAEEKNVAIFYYASWCPRCKNAIKLMKEPVMSALGEAGIKFATCDCQLEAHKELCRDKMTHLPLLEVFKDGKETFNSEKNSGGEIVDWANESVESMLDGILGKPNKNVRRGEGEEQNEQGEEGPEGEEGQEGPEGDAQSAPRDEL